MGSSWEEKWYDVNLINRTYSKKVKKRPSLHLSIITLP